MKIKKEIKEILDINTESVDIIYSEKRLLKHIIRRKHEDVLPYFSQIENIINNPDYVGINPNEKGTTLEYVKIFKDNVLVALKLHRNEKHFYIPTMYTINNYKLNRRIHSGRLKCIDKKD